MKIVPGVTEAVEGNDIPLGTVFRGEIGTHYSVFLRAAYVIVDLEDPGCTWNTTGSSAALPRVKYYQVLRTELRILV